MNGDTQALQVIDGEVPPDAPSIDELAAAIVPAPTGLPMEQDLLQLGRAMASSGFFKDASRASQAIVKILAGRELGIGPSAAMAGIHIIDGKTVLSAGLIASAIKRSERYNFRVKTLTPTTCVLMFFEDGQGIGESTFTIEDAQAAGLTNKGVWKSYPRNMLFARALTNGARWYCAGVFGGSVYEAEEMGGDAKPHWETPDA